MTLPISSPPSWAVLQAWAPRPSPEVSTRVSRERTSAHAPATSLQPKPPRHAPVRRPTCLGASAEVVWTSAPRRPLDSNTTVGTRGVLAVIGAITDQALSHKKTPAPSPRLENTNLPSHLLRRLRCCCPGPLPFLIQTRLLKKAVTDNINYQPVGRDPPPALLTIWPLSSHIRPRLTCDPSHF